MYGTIATYGHIAIYGNLQTDRFIYALTYIAIYVNIFTRKNITKRKKNEKNLKKQIILINIQLVYVCGWLVPVSIP